MVPEITLRKLLREFERTVGYFETNGDEEGLRLVGETKAAIDRHYEGAVNWDPFLQLGSDPRADELVTEDGVLTPYLACNRRCGELLEASQR
ncbi:hypothetical protein CMI48_04185 [Candidatus Pacearchaeota archaeon]|nr:hypothetical protein [Candidatus Pacearchaeota archaeon]|tara:strand:+ start:823 stop:1098 length:276 start_codon:yes stop_codon:yes gene_type:complete